MNQTKQTKLFILAAVLYFSGDVHVTEAFSTPTSMFRSSNLQMGLSLPQWCKKHSITSRSNNINSKKSMSLFPKLSSSTATATATSSSRIISTTLQKLRRTMAIFLTSAFLLLGPMNLNLKSDHAFRPSSAHASTTTISNNKQNLDKIIDQYVQKHMFNDDLYDPIESTYRETISDASTSAYPTELSAAASSVLGKKLSKVAQGSSASSGVATEGQGIKYILRLVDTIHVKFGVPKPMIVPILFLVGGGIPVMLALSLLMSFSMNQKAMTERMAQKRYGDDVTTDAQEIIIQDDDDDDDDEYDYDNEDYDSDDDDDDSDDDDDDDDDDKKGKRK